MKNKVCRERKCRDRAASYKKLQLLRSVTNSHALSKTSIILDATKYMAELKQRVERINQDIIAMAQSSTCHNNSFPVDQQVRVEARNKGFLIKVLSGRSCRGLLVCILEALEELRLDVLQARVSCSDCFLFEAAVVMQEEEEGSESCLDAVNVKQAVSQAIQNWISAAVINEQY